MVGTGAAADAEGVTFFTTSNPQHPEPAMQFFASSQSPWSTSKLPATAVPARAGGAAAPAPKKPELCGWYDSSFDLARGLEVSEEDCDTLYQLWDLSQR
jgi:hypothetical protein